MGRPLMGRPKVLGGRVVESCLCPCVLAFSVYWTCSWFMKNGFCHTSKIASLGQKLGSNYISSKPVIKAPVHCLYCLTPPISAFLNLPLFFFVFFLTLFDFCLATLGWCYMTLEPQHRLTSTPIDPCNKQVEVQLAFSTHFKFMNQSVQNGCLFRYWILERATWG